MINLPVSGGRFTKIDNEDYELLSKFTWYFWTDGVFCQQRIKETGKKKTIRINRLIMKYPKSMVVDHINHDILDNRKCNLRICTIGQNDKNQKLRRTSTSGFKGVTWNTKDKKWRAKIRLNYKYIFLGGFDNKIDAAKAYDEGATKYHGEFACTNKSLGLLTL